MRKLLNSEIRHLVRSKLFRLEILFFAGFSGFMMIVLHGVVSYGLGYLMFRRKDIK